MRVGLFSSTVREPGRWPAGADVMVGRLAERLAARGHEVVLFTYSPVESNGHPYEVRRMHPAPWRDHKLQRMLLIPARFGRADLSGVDVLHLHGDDWFFFRRPVPTVRTFHGSALHEARTATSWRRRFGQGVHFPLELLASRLATSTYGLIPGDAWFYRSSGELPSGVDVPDDTAKRDGPPTILFVGTWRGRKRGAAVARAFTQHVRPRIPDAALIMVCDDCESAPGIEHIPFVDDDERLFGLFARAWVFCLPSAYEGFGIPYLEAMASGAAVVCTSNPGSRHILRDGRDGRIVDLDGLGPALADLLENDQERRRLVDAGRDRVVEFSWDAICEDHERAYETAISRWSRRTRRGTR